MGRKTSHSLPSFESLWHEHKTLYSFIFSQALARLAEKHFYMEQENKISEQLCLILSEVCFEESQNRKKNKRKDIEIRVPDAENPIPPKTESDLKGNIAKSKRPDFTCKLFNPFASCSEKYEIALHVECKRLGNPTSNNWALNKNYTIEGIKRFDDKFHEYGKRAPSGMMIGYIISMEKKQIVCEVNKFQKEIFPDNPELFFEFNDSPVAKEKQSLKRKNVNPEDFQLIHLWADLRR